MLSGNSSLRTLSSKAEWLSPEVMRYCLVWTHGGNFSRGLKHSKLSLISHEPEVLSSLSDLEVQSSIQGRQHLSNKHILELSWLGAS